MGIGLENNLKNLWKRLDKVQEGLYSFFCW